MLALVFLPLPSADTTQGRWLADLDPAHVAELAVPGPLPAAGRARLHWHRCRELS